MSYFPARWLHARHAHMLAFLTTLDSVTPRRAACLSRSLWSRSPGCSECLKKEKKRLLMFANRAAATCWLALLPQFRSLSSTGLRSAQPPYLMQTSDCGPLCHVTGRGTTAEASPQCPRSLARSLILSLARSLARSLSSITLSLFSLSPAARRQTARQPHGAALRCQGLCWQQRHSQHGHL